MAEFIIQSSDGTYTYNSLTAGNGGCKTATISFSNEANNKFSDTQGFLRKKQVGRNRVKVSVDLVVAQTDYENIFIPLDVYQDTVECTFDRNIPGKTSTQGTFILEKIAVKKELPGPTYNIELSLTEKISSI